MPCVLVQRQLCDTSHTTMLHLMLRVLHHPMLLQARLGPRGGGVVGGEVVVYASSAFPNLGHMVAEQLHVAGSRFTLIGVGFEAPIHLELLCQ